MKLCFLQYGNRGEDQQLARIMLDSVSSSLTNCNREFGILEVLHFTDNSTISPFRQSIPYADDMFGTYYAKHLSRLDDDPTIIADVDVIFKSDIRDLFQEKFDVALTLREGWYDGCGKTKYIGGFMLSRCGEYWKRVRDIVNQMPGPLRAWMGIQMALEIAARDFHVWDLPEAVYNYAPKSADDPCDGARVVHYRGTRKYWMLGDKTAAFIPSSDQ